MPVEQTPWLAQRYQAGDTLRALAERTGISVSSIRRMLLQAGVTLRSRGNRHSRPQRR